jgi:beta-galactosidase
VRVVYATAEALQIAPDAITFRLTQPQDVIMIESQRQVAPSEDYRIERQGRTTLIISRKHAAVDDRLVARWR